MKEITADTISDSAWVTRFLEDIGRLREEMKHGGDQPPCPLCGVPRCRRSDYIRCHPCATNWLNGEDITRDPKIERYKNFLAESNAAAASQKKKPAKEEPSG